MKVASRELKVDESWKLVKVESQRLMKVECLSWMLEVESWK